MRSSFLSRKPIIVAAAILVLMGGAPASSAQAQAKDRSQGLSFTLGLGVSGCTDTACSDLDPSAGLRLQVLYQFLPYLAAGVHTGFFFAESSNDRYRDHAWSTLIGGEVRGILPVGPLEAWVALAMGYMRMQSDAYNPVDWLFGDGDTIWTNGFGFGFGFGTQYFIVPQFALGLDFFLYKGVFTRGCYLDESDDNRVDCRDLTNTQKESIGVVFSFGLTATFFLSL